MSAVATFRYPVTDPYRETGELTRNAKDALPKALQYRRLRTVAPPTVTLGPDGDIHVRATVTPIKTRAEIAKDKREAREYTINETEWLLDGGVFVLDIPARVGNYTDGDVDSLVEHLRAWGQPDLADRVRDRAERCR